jgi:hypothetical protein
MKFINKVAAFLAIGQVLYQQEVILLEKTHKTFSVSVFDVGNNPTNFLPKKGV